MTLRTKIKAYGRQRLRDTAHGHAHSLEGRGHGSPVAMAHDVRYRAVRGAERLAKAIRSWRKRRR